jgi:hypothetical protein
VRIISERDCHGIENNPDNAPYLPLYVKLHGTASEPTSLRFTRDAYYAVSPALGKLVKELLGLETGILLNIGFGLTSFDFIQFLGRPTVLQLYNISKTEVLDDVEKEINDVRKSEKKSKAQIINILVKDSNSNVEDLNSNTQFPRIGGTDWVLDTIVGWLEEECKKTGGLVNFRSAARHRMVAGLLNWDYELVRDPDKYSTYLARPGSGVNIFACKRPLCEVLRFVCSAMSS